MNLDETKKYIDQRLNNLGWAIQIDKGGYEKIHLHTEGAEDRLNQLYYKMVSIGSQRPKREINDVVLTAAIDDLTRMAEILEHAHKKTVPNHNLDNDRLTIDQLAKSLETAAAVELKADRKAAETSASVKPRGNGSKDTAYKAAGTAALPTILIVDDSPTVRAAVIKALGKSFNIVQASDGEDAWIHLLTNNNIELVVTDLMMPNLDGFGLIKRIRTDRALSHLVGLPIIVVTTIEDADAKLRALAAGANDFIAKNTDTAELQARVLTRYKLAQTLKEAEWQKISGRKQSPAMPPPSANTSGSPSAVHSMSTPRSSAKLSTQDNRSQDKVAAVGKPQTGKLEEQRPAARGFVKPTIPGSNQSSLGKSTQPGSIAPKKTSWFNSTIMLTLTATLLVALIIAGVIHLEQPKPMVAEKPAELAQTDASLAKGSVESDQPQPLSTQNASSDLSNPASVPSPDITSQKMENGAVTEKDTAAPTGHDQSSVAERDGSPENAAASRPDKAVIPVEPAASTKKLKRHERPAAIEVPPKTHVIQARPTQALPPPEDRNSEQNSKRVAAAVPATTPVAPAQPTQAAAPPEEHNPAGSQHAGGTSSPVPAAAPSPQQSASDAASVAMLDRNTVDSSIATIVPGLASSNISQAELVTLLRKFVFVYEAGDIEQFLSLFDNDVRTNDQTSKAGLRQDYEELFQTTDMRHMILGTVTWELNNNQGHGWGNFEVKVRKTGSPETKTFNGSLTFHVEKRNGRLLIKQLYYGQWKAAGSG